MSETRPPSPGSEGMDINRLKERAEQLHGLSHDEVLAVNRAILAHEPGDAAATNRLSTALRDRGEEEAAAEVLQAGLANNPGNAIASKRLEEFASWGRLAPASRRTGEHVRRDPASIVSSALGGPGRDESLVFMARSIRAIERLDAQRLAVTDIPSQDRFRVVGGIYTAVGPWKDFLCVSIDRRRSKSLVDAIQARGGEITDEPGPQSAVPNALNVAVPRAVVGSFIDELFAPHVEHLKESIDWGPPTHLHEHDPSLMRYLLAEADRINNRV